MTAVMTFYLHNDFIHRDIKEQNIVISKTGVVKIIDHGSIAPLVL
jgi:serine/threonine protein kinase